LADLYRYSDAQGVEHLVESKERVPKAYRAKAKEVTAQVAVEPHSPIKELQDQATLQALRAGTQTVRRAEDALHSVGWAWQLHVPSLLLGAGLVTALVLAWSMWRKQRRRVLKVAGLVGVVTSMLMGYATWLRMAVGLASNATAPVIATPKTLVDDAKAVRDVAQKRMQEQTHALEQIEALEKR
jgi:hypothetical protein